MQNVYLIYYMLFFCPPVSAFLVHLYSLQVLFKAQVSQSYYSYPSVWISFLYNFYFLLYINFSVNLSSLPTVSTCHFCSVSFSGNDWYSYYVVDLYLLLKDSSLAKKQRKRFLYHSNKSQNSSVMSVPLNKKRVLCTVYNLFIRCKPVHWTNIDLSLERRRLHFVPLCLWLFWRRVYATWWISIDNYRNNHY
jgi:hypothetical protein